MKRDEESREEWKEDKKGVYSIRGLYSLLEIDYLMLFPLKIIWNLWIPIKVILFGRLQR